MRRSKKPFIIPEDYPFKEAVADQAKLMKMSKDSNTYKRITIIEEIPYISSAEAMFVKLFRNKNALRMLSPAACKILIYICYTLEYGETMLILREKDVDLSHVTFYKAIMDLMVNGIVRKVKGKKELYWINVTLVSNGDAHNKLLR